MNNKIIRVHILDDVNPFCLLLVLLWYISGEQAHFADAFANDQDWALAFYLMINE